MTISCRVGRGGILCHPFFMQSVCKFNLQIIRLLLGIVKVLTIFAQNDNTKTDVIWQID